MPGMTRASRAPLESARVGNKTVWDAGCSVPSAVMTTLLDNPVRCIPHRELTNVLDAPESNTARVIASSTALALRCAETLSACCRSSRCAQRLESFEMGLGPWSGTGTLV